MAFFLSDFIDLFCSIFKLDSNCTIMFCLFLLCNKVSQLYVYTHPFPIEPPSLSTRLGHPRALSWAPQAMQPLPASYLLHTAVCICQSYSPNLSHHPPPAASPCPQVCSLLLHLSSCSANRLICTTFLDSIRIHCVCLVAQSCPALCDPHGL